MLSPTPALKRSNEIAARSGEEIINDSARRMADFATKFTNPTGRSWCPMGECGPTVVNHRDGGGSAAVAVRSPVASISKVGLFRTMQYVMCRGNIVAAGPG